MKRRYINRIDANTALRKIFKSVDRRFYKINEHNIDIIIDQFKKIAKKVDLSKARLTAPDFVDIPFYQKRNILAFSFDQYDGALTEADVRWTILHEVGHYHDFIEGRLTYNNSGNIVFAGQKINKALYDFCFADDSYESTVEYYKIPNELSANIFAVRHAKYIPDDENYRIGYDIAVKALQK